MPEDTFDDIRERLFEAAWSEPTYVPDRDRVVARARRRARVTIAGGVLAAAAAAAIAVAATVLPSTGERTARFPVPVDNREFAVDLDGGTVRELHSFPEGAWLFELSPAGDRIAFASEASGTTQVWVAAPDGSGAEPVTDDPVEAQAPAWSPDGRSIAYVGWGRHGSGRDLFILDLATGRSRRVLRTELDELNPAWSPDGTRILYTVAIEGAAPDTAVEGAIGVPTSLRLEVVDLRTRDVSVVAGGPTNMASDGSWLSTDRVVYMKGFGVGFHDPVRWALVASSPDGSDRQEITDVPSDHYAWEAAVSPDGTRIAFASDLDRSHWILVHDLRTGETTRLTRGWYPAWIDDHTLLVQRSPA
jgi:dipeptidyl aminopeptidase/acylaminoacyl peptidase